MPHTISFPTVYKLPRLPLLEKWENCIWRRNSTRKWEKQGNLIILSQLLHLNGFRSRFLFHSAFPSLGNALGGCSEWGSMGPKTRDFSKLWFNSCHSCTRQFLPLHDVTRTDLRGHEGCGGGMVRAARCDADRTGFGAGIRFVVANSPFFSAFPQLPRVSQRVRNISSV